MKTVANRLQDARHLSPVFIRNQSVELVGPDLVYVYVNEDPYHHDDALRWLSMASDYEVDGVQYPSRMNGNSRQMISIRDDHPSSCRPDAEGLCECPPSDYRPLSYRRGEICEQCWLRWQMVVGVGTEGCPHN